MENTKFMTVVYADNIGLVMQGGVSKVDCREGLNNTYIIPIYGDTWNQMMIDAHDLRGITGGSTLFVNVRRTEALTYTFGVKAYDEISFCDGKMYFTDMFSGEDKKIAISDLKYISTEL